MYYIFFSIVLLCYLFHTTVHILEHFKRISDNKNIHIAIGISMFIGWFSYFYISFNGFSLENLSAFNYMGLLVLIMGFYLFLVSHARVHKRMHSGKGKLITDGVYKHLRHPMYLGEIMMLLGAPLFGQSYLTVILSPIFIIQILIWRYFEEQELIKEFPEYSEYRKRTWF